MRVNLWIVDRMDDTILASFEKITLQHAAWIERKWRRKRIRLTEVIVFSHQCTPPPEVRDERGTHDPSMASD